MPTVPGGLKKDERSDSERMKGWRPMLLLPAQATSGAQPRWRIVSSFNPQLLAKHRTVAPSETLQISQAFAAAQDPEHGLLQAVPGEDSSPAPHAGVWNRLEEADQIEIGCSRARFGPREAEGLPRESNTESPGHGPWDTLGISTGVAPKAGMMA